jgi:predicted transcriptional regulator
MHIFTPDKDVSKKCVSFRSRHRERASDREQFIYPTSDIVHEMCHCFLNGKDGSVIIFVLLCSEKEVCKGQDISDDTHIYITEEGKYFVRNVSTIDRYLVTNQERNEVCR